MLLTTVDGLASAMAGSAPPSFGRGLGHRCGGEKSAAGRVAEVVSEGNAVREWCQRLYANERARAVPVAEQRKQILNVELLDTEYGSGRTAVNRATNRRGRRRARGRRS